MTTYRFSTLEPQQTLRFDPLRDVLRIDLVGVDASMGSFVQRGDVLEVTYAAKTVRLAGMSLTRASSARFTFLDGSRVLLGDDRPATLSDAKANALRGGARGDLLDGQAGDDTLEGRAGNDRLLGGKGNDVLDGGLGQDALLGGQGNDVYLVDDTGDRVTENVGEGNDEVRSRVDFILAAHVERLTLSGGDDLAGIGNRSNNVMLGNAGDNLLVGKAGDDRLMGAAGDDVLVGDTGNDTLDGGPGADVMRGGAGDDTYFVDDLEDVVRETDNAGDDRVLSTVSFVLGAHLERLTLQGSADLGGTGNGLANVITGNSGANRLSGAGGADTLRGEAGDDLLRVADTSFVEANGGEGVDWLILEGRDQRLDAAVAAGRLTALEAVDLGDGNQWRFDADVVRALSNTSNALTLRGGAASLLSAGAGWLRGADQVEAEVTYRTYTQGDASLRIDAAIGWQVVNGAAPLGALENGTSGARFVGTAGEFVGLGASALGDVNGDGRDDFILGAPGGGTAVVVYGRAQPFAFEQSLDALGGAAASRLVGATAGDFTGGAVAGVGDFNGDGLADVLIGAQGAAPAGANSGSAYLLYGNAAGFGTTLALGALDGSDGFRLDGRSMNDVTGAELGAAGDINGDGFDDVVISALFADPVGVGGARSNAGVSYVVFGGPGPRAATLNLGTLDGSNGFRVEGVTAGDVLGFVGTAVGDLNGDGIDDLVLGAPGADAAANGAGAVYVIFGSAAGFGVRVDLATLDGHSGFRIDGAVAGDGIGGAVSGAGDINGDGVADLLLGAPNVDTGGVDSGAAYVVFGRTTGFAATLSLATLDGDNGFRLQVSEASQGLGSSVSAAGDVNGDGFDDLLIASQRGFATGAPGASYLVFGSSAPFDAVMSLDALDLADGVRFDGRSAGDLSTGMVSAAGDVDGDGLDDVLIGAERAASTGIDAGEVGLVYGDPRLGPFARVGASGTDVFVGDAGVDQLNGAGGDDTLSGVGGADVLYGGAGDDRLSVADTGFRRVDGGLGDDTLMVAGFDFDLGAARGRLAGIEAIDLSGGGTHTLTLLARDVLNLSDTSNLLRVAGDAGDGVHFADGGWQQGVDLVLEDVTYHVFDHGAARVLLEPQLLVV